MQTTRPQPQKIPLPIDPLLSRIGTIVADQAKDLILVASTGSGKTTRVPPALIEAIPHGRVYVLEPRRLAARLSAERVAEESGWIVGEQVGYQFRFERRRTDRTRLTFLTEGTFTRELLSNPTLKGVNVVVLDEFHERHLQGDLALSLLRRLQRTTRPDLRIVVMSATLEKESLQKFLPEAEVVDVEAPRYPIEIEYAPSDRELSVQVRNAVKTLLARHDAEPFGDILVFLPGMADIRRAETALESVEGIQLIPLHGELTREEQELAFRPHVLTKVILATNIAESSLTIPGVNTVIDSGFARVASFSYWTGLPSLTTKAISRASAIQRAGRAGRTGPGRVLRLYSKGDYEGRAFADVPEIQRVDLMGPALELHFLIGKEAATFEFFESPESRKWKAAEESLFQIGALSPDGKIAPLGEKILKLPLHPRLGRLLLEAGTRGVLKGATLLVAALNEGSELGMDALEGLKRIAGDPAVRKMIQRLEPILRDLKTDEDGEVRGADETLELSAAALSAFPDRVGVKRGKELVLSAGGSVTYPVDPLFQHHEFFLVLDVRESRRLGEAQSRLELRSVLPLEELQLFDLVPPQLEEVREWEWSIPKKRWQCLEILNYQKLRLSSKIRDGESIRTSPRYLELLRRLFEEWRSEIQSDSKVRAAWVRDELRLGLMGEADPAGKIFDYFCEMFPDGASVRELPGWDGFWALVPVAERERLDKSVPTVVALAGRKNAPIIYEPGQTPYVESRIQDFFGMRTGPSYLGGSKRFALHLLAPNGRAVQITEDLEGFWKNHYPSVRKELMRRYPRHKWPEDPLVSNGA